MDYSRECQKKLSTTSETVEVCALLSLSDTVEFFTFEANTSSYVRSAAKLKFAVMLCHISATENWFEFPNLDSSKTTMPLKCFPTLLFWSFTILGLKIVFPSFGRVTPTSKPLSRAGADFYRALCKESRRPHGFCSVPPFYHTYYMNRHILRTH